MNFIQHYSKISLKVIKIKDKEKGNLMSSKYIGEYIRDERNKRKISVRQLALQSGISASYISRLENKKTKNVVKPTTIKKLAKGLRIDEDRLLKQYNLSGYNDELDNKIIKLPLIKNPLISSNINLHENLVKYLPFLKQQLSDDSKYVVQYRSEDMKKKIPLNSFVILSDIKELKNNQLVGMFESKKLKIGYLKFLEDKTILVNDNAEILKLDGNEELKNSLWKISLVFNKFEN